MSLLQSNIIAEVIEDFSTDLSNYSGNTGSYSIVSSPSISGDALQSDASFARIYDTSIQVQQGERYEIYMQAQGSSGVMIGHQGDNDLSGYGVNVDPNNVNDEGFSISKYVNGSENVLERASQQTFDGTWYRVVISWGVNGKLKGSLYDGGTELATIGITDTTYTSGGIGFTSSSEAGDIWDEFRRIG